MSETSNNFDGVQAVGQPQFSLDLNSAILGAADAATLAALEVTAARDIVSQAAELSGNVTPKQVASSLELTPALVMSLAIAESANATCVVASDLAQVAVTAATNALGGRGVNPSEASWSLRHLSDSDWMNGGVFSPPVDDVCPITVVLHRSGIQLSPILRNLADEDPRYCIDDGGWEIFEIPTFTEPEIVYEAYREAYSAARDGRSIMIFPTGVGGPNSDVRASVGCIGETFDIEAEVAVFADLHGVDLETPIWIPGSLVSYRDIAPMLAYIFYCNDLLVDGTVVDSGFSERDVESVLAGSMLRTTGLV